MWSLDYNVNMKEILTYKTKDGKCPFDIWMNSLDNIIIILLCAGDKSTQAKDIEKAKEYLQDLKERNI